MWHFWKTIRRIIVWTLKWLYAFYWKPLALYKKCKSKMGRLISKNQGSNSEMNFVGLNNQGATCYLNTLLQTWFMTREVKDCISRSHSPDLLIVALKELFEQLTSEQTNSVCTKKLTTCLQLDVSKQNDIEVCFRSLMSNLSTSMVEENNILKIYQVTMVHSMKCSECNQPLDNENLFLDIPLSMCSANTFVKFKCMEESLGAFLSVETMEGDNKCYCDICGKKTESTSRYYFKKLPQILTFQLKRFELDYNYMQYRKIIDRINLPSDLEFIKSQDDYNEWRLNLPVNKAASDPFGAGPDLMEPQAAAGPPADHSANFSNGTYRPANTPSLASHGHTSAAKLQGASCSRLRNPQRAQEETHASSKHCDEVTEGEQSSTSPLQGQSGNSGNCEGGTSETVQDQSEQVSPEDKAASDPFGAGPDLMEPQASAGPPADHSANSSNGTYRPANTPSLASHGHISAAELQGASSSRLRNPQRAQEEKFMEDSENSVDNPHVQGQFEITKEEGLTSNKVDKNPGPDGIHRTQLSEVNNSGNNTSLGAMEQGQNELSTLQGQEIYSVNDEERTTEAPGQSEQDSTVDKGTRASSKYCDEVTEAEQSSTSPLQGQSGNSENCEGGTSEAVQDQSEQVSPEDKENHPQNECCHEATKEGPSSISTLNMSKVNSADCEEKTSESAQDQSARDFTEQKENRAPNKSCSDATGGGQRFISTLYKSNANSEDCEGETSEAAQGWPEEDFTAQKDNYAPYKCSYEDTKEGQSPISTPHKQNENDEEREEGMLRAAQDQSEQDSAEKKIIQSKRLLRKKMWKKDKHHHKPKMCKQEIVWKINRSKGLLRKWMWKKDKHHHKPRKYKQEIVSKDVEKGQASPQAQDVQAGDCVEGDLDAAQDNLEQKSTEKEEKKYELFAIWHHVGSYGGGHYYAEIKSGSGDWYDFDDTHVKKIGKNITLSSTTAYMVMYRLIDTNKEAGSDATTPEQCQTQKPIPGTQEYRSQSTVNFDNYTGIVKDSRKSRIV